MHHLITSLKTLYSVHTAYLYVTFDRYSTHLLFPKYQPTGLYNINFLL